MKPCVIAIDGPGGVGKSTVSRLVAQKLGIRHVDTGAMYRAFALALDDAGVDPHNDAVLADFCKNAVVRYDYDTGFALINDRDYSGLVRSKKAGELASIASASVLVRDILTTLQRKVGLEGPVVMEGRDIGTVVFPDAALKVFLDASPEVRAQRRHADVATAPEGSLDEVKKSLDERDKRDSNRKTAPLKIADDAVYVDTGEISAEEAADRIVSLARGKREFGNTHS